MYTTFDDQYWVPLEKYEELERKIQKYFKSIFKLTEERDQLRQQLSSMQETMGGTEARYMEGLQSIANSTCCGDCQEAARVAKKVLEDEALMYEALNPTQDGR